MPMRKAHTKKNKKEGGESSKKNRDFKPMVVSDSATNADDEGSKRGEEGDRTQHLLK